MTEMQHHEEETTLRSYLLGLASAEEQKRVEERLLTDEDYFNELERIEECLTDEYVHGEIEGVQKEQFESHFLKSGEHREGLEFARLLDRYFSERDVASSSSLPSPPRWRGVMEVLLASAAIVLIAASVLLFRQVSNLRREVAHLQQERAAADERQRSLAGQLAGQQQLVTRLTQELADLKKPADLGDPAIVSLSLNPGLVRTGANIRRVIIPVHAQALLLELKLQGIHYRNYRVQVETAEGDVIWTVNGLIPHSIQHSGRKAVILVLPVAPLTRSQYLVKLTRPTQSGTAENVGTYYLNIRRK
jgi:hypothetical protein